MYFLKYVQRTKKSQNVSYFYWVLASTQKTSQTKYNIFSFSFIISELFKYALLH